MEIRYNRAAGTKAPTVTEAAEEREVSEDKQEVVVFFIPNMAHLVPNDEEWEKTRQVYAEALQKVLTPETDEAASKEEAPATQEAMDTSKADVSLNETADVSQSEPTDTAPTHYSKLDVNNMKVTASVLCFLVRLR